MVHRQSPHPPRDETVELEFSLRDESCFFVTASKRAGCELVGEKVVRRSDGNLLEFFDVRGTRPETLLDAVGSIQTAHDARIVRERPDSTLMSFVITGSCVTTTLADSDAVLKTARAENGDATVIADVPSYGSVRRVVETFEENHPTADLIAKRSLGASVPAIANRERTAYLLSNLTEKQLRAVEVAVRFGYLSWPRESTAAECADALDVSQPTFSQHLWTGVEKLLGTMFDGGTDV
ncbi:bacterio-opsin activator domain-containing protein [Haladaptatus caseinilyticus]|uniref:bacterio-opsin activator domain-containing protein n=1 Tax=Haladaptatus caseinilyticus TaxID=2993314 RepID=UPI00224B6D4E|nr:bacterio-opsin activator domain-containing protein [Haladaptatus caseinilyticus]